MADTLKKYLDQAGLEALIAKIKSEDDAHLQEAKNFVTGRDNLFETAGAGATAESNAKAYTDEKVAPLATKEEVNAVDGKVTAEETRAKAEEARIVGLVEATDAVADKAAEDVVALAQTHATDKAALEAKDTELAEAIEAVDGKIGEVAEGQTVMGIIQNIQENAYDDTELRGLITGLTNNKADKTQVATDIETAVNAEKSARETAVAGVQSAVDTLSGTHATDKKALEDAIALKADAATVNELAQAAATKVELKAEEDRAKGEEARIEGLVTAEATRAAGAEEALDERLVKVEAFFEGAAEDSEGLNDALNTLVEIQTYVDTHGEAAAKMVEDIVANAKAIEDHEKVNHDFAGADAALKSELEGKINAKADSSVVEAIDDRLEAEEGKVATLQGEMAQAKLDIDAVEAAVATKAEAQALTDEVTARTEADEALDERLQLVEAIVGGDGENTVSELIEAAKQEAINTASQDATGKANKALEDAKKYADDEDAKIEASVTELTGVVNGKAAQADLEALATRVGTAEGEIDTLQSEMDAVEALADAADKAAKANAEAIKLLAKQSDLEALTTRVSNNETAIAGKASQDDLDDAVERIAANETAIADNASAIAKFQPIPSTDIEGMFA